MRGSVHVQTKTASNLGFHTHNLEENEVNEKICDIFLVYKGGVKSLWEYSTNFLLGDQVPQCMEPIHRHF